MKWYKKQMDALKKEIAITAKPTSDESAHASVAPKLRGHKTAHSPVAQRNRNRKKTDSK